MTGLEVTKEDIEKQEDTENSADSDKGIKDTVKGAGVVDDIGGLYADIHSGNLAGSLIGAAGIAGSVAEFAADPLAALMSAGFGWLMEHIDFLKEPLDWLTGDQSAIKAASATWGNVAKDLNESRTQLEETIRADTAPWHGPAIDTYVPAANTHAKLISGASVGAQATSTVVDICGQVLDVVRNVVRDLIAKAAGDIAACLLEWAAAEFLSFGLATPGMIADGVRRAVQWSKRIMEWVKKVTDVFKRAFEYLKRLEPMLDKLKGTLKGPLEGLGETKLGQAASKAWTPFKDVEEGAGRTIRHSYAKAPGYDEAGNLVHSHSKVEWPKIDVDTKETANSLAEEGRKKAAEDFDNWSHAQNEKDKQKTE